MPDISRSVGRTGVNDDDEVTRLALRKKKLEVLLHTRLQPGDRGRE